MTLVLLPPSEGKAVGSRGAPLDLDRLSFPELHDRRRQVVDALVAASARPDALEVLQCTEGRGRPGGRQRRPVVGADAASCGPVHGRALRRARPRVPRCGREAPGRSPAGRGQRPVRRAPSRRPGALVPPVHGRGPAGRGPLARGWREPLDRVLPTAAGRGIVVDLRSSTYVAAWKPSGGLAERTVSVHVVRDGPGGRTAVSHMAKHTRGLVARELLASGADPRRPEELADVLAATFAVHLDDALPGRPRRLEVVEPG